jgi:hypothetical protein
VKRKAAYQFVRKAVDTWEIYYVEPMDTGASESRSDTYQVVAKVFRDQEHDCYFIERPVWHANGFEWYRMPKEYITKKAAFKAVLEPPKDTQ